ncbi:hypothetical protein QJQ45_021872 [Haematococcus lacustris]|nr:hypothetical protein QJQ45_021872 [Haematococcus lacustris]
MQVHRPLDLPTEAQLELVHSQEYLHAFLHGRLDEQRMRRIGLGAEAIRSPVLIKRTLAEVAGTLLTARLALRCGLAVNTAGGTHHAHPAHGSGFCILNDLATTAKVLLAEGAVSRLLVVDLDVHQGDGTAVCLADEPRAFTFSMHCESNFPARKATSDLDIGLPDGCADAQFMACLGRTLPELLDSLQAGTVRTQASYNDVASPATSSMDDQQVVERLGEAARNALIRATSAVKRYGWLSFWVQMTLSVVSGVILLFSVAFTSQTGPRASLYLTLIGILAGFFSTFWNFNYTRMALRMQRYVDAVPGDSVPKVKKQTLCALAMPQVIDTVTKGVLINVLGLGSTLLGIQALVGVLVAKTLSNASANPFIASAAGVYNPVLALDVFLVQAATNMLLGHFLSMVCSLWLLSVVGEGRGLRFQRFLSLKRLKTRVEDSAVIIGKGNAATFRVDTTRVR